MGVDPNAVQSSVSILLAMYTAGLIAASPIIGWTSGARDFEGILRVDHFGLVLMAGLAALLGAAFMLCFGSSEAVLMVARILQCISAAVVWSVGVAFIWGERINSYDWH